MNPKATPEVTALAHIYTDVTSNNTVFSFAAEELLRDGVEKGA